MRKPGFSYIRANIPQSKRKLAQLAALMVLTLLCGCGTKEIGEGTSDYVSATPRDASTADHMRYPMIGASNTQQMLYWYNKPDVMQNYQEWKLGQYRRLMGIKPDPEDPAYRAMPKQRSPFRQ